MRSLIFAFFAAALPLAASGCAGMAPRIYSPVHTGGGVETRGDHAREIDGLASELVERAESRSPLGNARVRVEDLDAIEPRRSPYRQVSVLERDLRATESTLRHELAMSLSNRINVVGASAEISTHRIEGEFLRSATAVELSLRLVEIKSDWIVATARRRIENFVPEHYDRRLQAAEPELPTAQEAADDSPPSRSDAVAPSVARNRARALRPAFPPGEPQVQVQVPEPVSVLSAH